MSSNEAHWEPLAEIYLSYPEVSSTTGGSISSGSTSSTTREKKNCTYCLCSRVFIRNYYDVYVSTLERLEPSMPETPSEQQKLQESIVTAEQQKVERVCKQLDHEPLAADTVLPSAEEIEDDVFSEEPVLRKQLSFSRNPLALKWEAASSEVSCYFSASASHSDTNYCSTDEHEHNLHGGGSMRGVTSSGGHKVYSYHHGGLHSSDSGADISEKNFGESLHKPEDFFEGVQELLTEESSRVATSLVHAERNNSLPEVFGREDLQEAWETYWNKHGESIIWASWIEKYSDYINPEYLDQVPAHGTGSNDSPHSKSEATPDTTYDASKHFSFDNTESFEPKAPPTEIIVSTCSPHPYSRNDGWNPLNTSPGGDQDIWTAHRSNSAENDALLSPRCDSVTSSIPLTIGTTDSMTNVTRMTISSYGFEDSSKVSSESSHLSESSLSEQLSSGITDSSNSSDMLATEFQVGASSNLQQDDENTQDGEQYWQILWQKHFQELYAKHYNLFMLERSEEAEVPGNVNQHPRLHKRKRNSSSGSGLVRAADQLPEMVAQLKLDLSSPQKKDSSAPAVDADSEQKSSTDKNTKQQQSQSTESTGDHLVENLAEALEAYGLPTSFGKSTKKSNNGGGDEDPPEDRPVTLKRCHESDTEESPNDRLKAAFELMGYAFSDPANRNESADSIINITGEVVYRKKHIRLHNRVLKMRQHHKPKHTYFDDDGNEITVAGIGGSEKGDAAPEALMHTSSDDDDPAVAAAVGQSGARSVSSSVRSSAILDYNVQLQAKEIESQDDNEEEKHDENPPSEEALDEVAQPPAKKEKKKKRKPKFVASLPPEIANDKSLLKYWYKRFSLFSLFDAGIKLDRESWFSVTPEKVASHTAERCRSDLLVDGFCGCGGNAIQFAFTCQRVIAIDIDPRKIEMARHNATVYGVADRIEFVVGDFLQLADRLRADTVFLSPPWGGPSYMKDEVYDLEASLVPVPASELMRKARQISSNVAIYLPRNSNAQQLTMLAGPNNAVEVEQNFLDRKLIALTAYYGDLINE